MLYNLRTLGAKWSDLISRSTGEAPELVASRLLPNAAQDAHITPHPSLPLMTSQPDSTIVNWLGSVEPPAAPDLIDPTDSLYSVVRPDFQRKRKRGCNSQFPSPPTSSCHLRPLPITQGQTMTSSFTSPKKRKTTTEDNRDTQLTPRATRRYDDDTSSTSSLPRSESLSQTSARSPTKISPFLQLDPAGFEIGPLDLDDPDMPEAAKQFIEEIDTIAAGHHVVPAILKEDINSLKKKSRSYVSFRDYVYTDISEEDDKPSVDRFLEDVSKTVAVAQECQRIEQDETGWNHLVHSPLLDTILDRQSQNITGFVPCMSASILPEWRLQAKLGTRIDYAIVINPEHDPQSGVQTAVQRLRYTLPEASANHTGFAPLRHRPIGISIETKRYGGDEHKAEFQLGIWHSAQWKLLAEQAGDSVAHLAFIPGIIVQGHDWKLVVTTYKEGKTRLWASRQFGSTQTPLGTFQVIAGVRRLASWTRKEFWLWYKTYLLQLPPDGGPDLIRNLIVQSDESRSAG